MWLLKGKTILLTGGTGSFGRAFAKIILSEYPDIKELIIFSRNEQLQHQMGIKFPKSQFPQIRFMIGDVRDSKRVLYACGGVDIVVHAAAMIHVPIAEENPLECIKTNIDGAVNVIKAAQFHSIKKVIALSTDKSCMPSNLYGATKMISDKLFLNASNNSSHEKTLFSIVRYGNVLGAVGSVIPFFMKTKKNGKLSITDARMTRFTISPTEAVNTVLFSLKHGSGGEVFVPKLKSYRITDVAKAISANAKIEAVGIRPGEKLHETLVSEFESCYTWDIGDYYLVIPALRDQKRSMLLKNEHSKKVMERFVYQSQTNTEWETVDSLKAKIQNIMNVFFLNDEGVN